MQFEWLFFFLLKSHTTNELEATVRQVLMEAKCSGKHNINNAHSVLLQSNQTQLFVRKKANTYE